jgi:hypothetical protein
MAPGPRDHLITRGLERELDRLDLEVRVEARLDPAEGPARLARHAMREVERELAVDETAEVQTERLNGLLQQLVGEGEDALPAQVALPPRVLYGIKARSPLGDPIDLPTLPATPFSQSDLLVNAEGQPNIGSELKAELGTAQSVDLICAFVIWTGVRHLRDSLAQVVARGGRVRVITMTYMGATEWRAVDELFALGAHSRSPSMPGPARVLRLEGARALHGPKVHRRRLASIALTGDDSPDVRDQGLSDLKAGRIRCVFSVEVLGEGVDVPNVDTVLLLRPTQSATIFTQQLGRGLRRAQGKNSLTVLDLIGQQHREFHFDDRLRAILDPRRGPILKQVEQEFPFLPAGCTVDLDRRSQEIILDNLRSAVQRSRWATLVSDLRSEADGIRLTELRHPTHRVAQEARPSAGGHLQDQPLPDEPEKRCRPPDSWSDGRRLRAPDSPGGGRTRSRKVVH